jgi:hypothetical protein
METRYTKLQSIKEHVRGFQTPSAVIDCFDNLCDIIGELSDDVSVLMSEVQDLTRKCNDITSVPEVVVSEPPVEDPTPTGKTKKSKSATNKK